LPAFAFDLTLQCFIDWLINDGSCFGERFQTSSIRADFKSIKWLAFITYHVLEIGLSQFLEFDFIFMDHLLDVVLN